MDEMQIEGLADMAMEELGVLLSAAKASDMATNIISQDVSHVDTDVLYAAAHFAFDQKQYVTAGQIFSILVTVAPETRDYWMGYGICLRCQDHFASAHEAFLNVLTINPKDLDAFYRLAELTMAQNDMTQARAYLHRCTKAVRAGHMHPVEAGIRRLGQYAAQLIRWNALMMGPMNVSRLIQITARTDVAQAVSEISFIQQIKQGMPAYPPQNPRDDNKDRVTDNRSAGTSRRQAKSTSGAGGQNSGSMASPPTSPNTPLGRAGTLMGLSKPVLQPSDPNIPRAQRKIPEHTPGQIYAKRCTTRAPTATIATQRSLTILLTALGQLARTPTNATPPLPQGTSIPETGLVASQSGPNPPPNPTATAIPTQGVNVPGATLGNAQTAPMVPAAQTPATPNIATSQAMTPPPLQTPPPIAAVPSAPIGQDLSWLVAVNAALIPGWPNLTGKLQTASQQNQYIKDALAMVASQMRGLTPDQRAQLLAQMGLPAKALHLLEQVARRLADKMQDPLDPNVIAGFLMAMLTTLGQMSDALRYVYNILPNIPDPQRDLDN